MKRTSTLLALELVTPSGSYSKTDLVNLGRNYWTLEPAVAISYTQPAGINADIKLHYDFNWKNKATQYRSGQEFHFVFRDTAGEFDIFGVNTPFNRSGRGVLAQAMGDAWTSFAHTGVPNLPSHEWSRRSLEKGRPDCLLFDTPRDGGIRMVRIRTDMAAVKEALRTDTAAEPATLRCRIHARLFVWNPLFAGHGDASEYERWSRESGCAVPAIEFRPRVEV